MTTPKRSTHAAQTPAQEAKEQYNHEMESLKNRINALETDLKNKTAAYDALLSSEESASSRCTKLEQENKTLSEETERLKMQLADRPVDTEQCSSPREGHTPLVHAVPPEIRAALVIFSLGAIRDRQNDAPMDKKNFEHMVDPFIEQAEYIADRVIERMTTNRKPSVDEVQKT